MSSVLIEKFRRDIPITMLHGILKQHVIIYPPPYNIRSILNEYIAQNGIQIQIRIEHSSRNVNIVQASISSHVLQVTVGAFQNHRLQMPVRQMPSMEAMFRNASISQRPSLDEMFTRNRVRPAQTSASSGKTCSICMEDILVSELQILRCAHYFHTHCIQRWSMEQNNCPECRTPLT